MESLLIEMGASLLTSGKLCSFTLADYLDQRFKRCNNALYRLRHFPTIRKNIKNKLGRQVTERASKTAPRIGS